MDTYYIERKRNNKEEYAKVCHEVNTLYSKYAGKRIIMHRTRDLDDNWCIYFIENLGYDDYIFIDKHYE